MKPNNVFLVTCTEDSFYRAWIEFLTPYHKLTSREREVAARLLMQYFKFRSSVSDPEVLHELMWSKRSRKDIMESLGMSPAHFQMVLGKLKSSGFLKDGDINPRFIPHTVEGDSRFMLQVMFDWSSSTKLIDRNAEQNREQ